MGNVPWFCITARALQQVILTVQNNIGTDAPSWSEVPVKCLKGTKKTTPTPVTVCLLCCSLLSKRYLPPDSEAALFHFRLWDYITHPFNHFYFCDYQFISSAFLFSGKMIELFWNFGIAVLWQQIVRYHICITVYCEFPHLFESWLSRSIFCLWMSTL